MAEVFAPAGSSFIDQLEYDKDTDDLTITFNDGFEAVYHNVTPATFRNFCLAPSAGGFFHRHIKDRYAWDPA